MISYIPIFLLFSPQICLVSLRGHSCCSALIKLTDDWRAALDNKKEIGVIAIDLSKAFDSICHNLLSAKLKAYGLSKSAIQSFLSF